MIWFLLVDLEDIDTDSEVILRSVSFLLSMQCNVTIRN